MLALAEYRIASGDPRFDRAARQLASFLKEMQRDDGLFYHQWYPATGIDREIPWPEDAGGMAFTHMMTPHTGGSATAAEAMVAAILLGDAESFDTTALRAQLFDTFEFLR